MSPLAALPSVAAAAAAALRDMNPHVTVTVLPSPAVEPPALAALLRGAAAVVVAGGPTPATPFALAVDAAAADAGAAFFWGGVRGGAGWCFLNAHSHSWAPGAGEGGVAGGAAAGAPTHPPTLHHARYAPLERALRHTWAGLHPRRTHGLAYALRAVADFEVHAHAAPTPSDLAAVIDRGHALAAADGVAPHSLSRFVDDGSLAAFVAATGEHPAAAAVVGGTLAGEAVKVVTRVGKPLDNLFLFSMSDGRGVVERLGEPPAPAGDGVVEVESVVV